MLWLIGIGAALCVLVYAASLGAMRQTERDGVIEPTGQYDFDIVGESHYQPALRKIAGPGDVRHKCEATLVLDDANPYDRNAVRVEIQDMIVGHFARARAVEYREQTARYGRVRTRCNAVIVGGGNGRSLGVWLDIPVRK
jgi:hypothetical protein